MAKVILQTTLDRRDSPDIGVVNLKNHRKNAAGTPTRPPPSTTTQIKKYAVPVEVLVHEKLDHAGVKNHVDSEG